MYAKIFSQIFDSSIADNYEVRHFFMDLIVLADVNGVVDMTHSALAARTRIPLEKVQSFIAALEAPDPESRTAEESGARIIKLDEHRSWGWEIVNYQRFRKLASEEQRRERTKLRLRKFRQNQALAKDVTHGNAHETLSNDSPSPSPSACTQGRKGTGKEGGSTQLKEVFDYWNESDLLPRCLLLSDKRRRSLEIRLGDPFFKSNWKAAIDRMRLSHFCRGQNDRGWRASFDWFLQPDTCQKIMEGKYDNRTAAQTGTNGTGHLPFYRSNNPTGTDRNAGTSNEKRIGQYDGVGKIL